MNKPVRVFVVDDSALMRHRLSAIIQAAPGYQVVGQAGDGNACLTQLREIRPDVVTLDVEMPGLDGLSTLRRIMQDQPTPVLMISSTTESGAKTTIDALARGAIDYLTKPDSFAPETRAQFGVELIAKLDVVSRARMSAGARRPTPIRAYAPARASLTHAGPAHGTPLVVIGSSTGGPQALDQIFDQLSAALGAAFLVVQHMPPVFTRSLAARLARRSTLPVQEAAEGDRLAEHTALVAPGGWHTTIDKDGMVHLDQTPPIHGVRPAIDRTLATIAKHWQGPCLVVILTGMGVDGAAGARALKNNGAEVLAQDEESCVVFGMPRAVIEAGLASAILPIEQMADAIQQWVRLVPHCASMT